MVNANLSSFMESLKSLEAVDSIRAYRHQLEHLRQIELEKALLQLRSGADPEQVLSRMSRTLMNKVMHKPTAAIKRAAEKGQIDQIEWAQQLLGIDPPNKPD